jgi:predicted polyphosphate/ATP-dependent NAD kinase
MPRLGLIVNPIAGLGGRVGLKGTDGPDTVATALAAGAAPEAAAKGLRALRRFVGSTSGLVVATVPGAMGGALIPPGLPIEWVHVDIGEVTAARDTLRAAAEMVEAGVDLLLFVGGDGTARDILDVVGSSIVALGVPAGVKIQSAVFGATPEAAGDLAGRFLADPGRTRVVEAEVLDIDEDEFRRDRVSSRLHGYLLVPVERRLLQGGKSGSDPSDAGDIRAIAAEVASSMQAGATYVFGPGSTTSAVFDLLGLPKTLLGVDVVRDGEVVAADASENDLLRWKARGPLTIVVSLIGGQGFVLGRGNQQISPPVLRSLTRSSLWILATPRKLAALGGRDLLVDTGDVGLDASLEGYVQVIVGVGRRAICHLGHPA